MSFSRLRINDALLELFRQHRVGHKMTSGERWRVGDILRVHDNAVLESYALIFAGDTIPRAMGAFSYVHSRLDPNFSMGRYCSLSWDIRVMGSTHPINWVTTSPFSYDPAPLPSIRTFLTEDRNITHFPLQNFDPLVTEAVTLGHDVWVGAEVMFKRGITVGHGAVIAARSLVTKDVPPYAIVGGSPARVIRMRFPEELATRLLATEWWRFGPDVLQRLDVTSPERFVERFEANEIGDAREIDRPALTAARVIEVASEQAL